MIHDKPPGAGGLRRHVDDLTAGLSARGVRVTRLRIARAGDPGPRGDDHVLPLGFRGDDAAGEIGGLLAVLARADPGVVHLHLGFTALSPSGVAALAARLPLVATLHDVLPFCPNGTRLTILRDAPCGRRQGPVCYATLCAGRGGPRALAAAFAIASIRRRAWDALCMAARFLAPSSFIRDLALGAGLPDERVDLLPHGTAWADEPPPPPNAGGTPRFVYSGRLDPLKDVALVLRALALSRDRAWRFAICGEGPDGPRLRRLAQELGLAERVDFLGALPRGALRSELVAAQALLFPSRIPEALGLAGIEALALARPVVGYPVGGAADWLRDGESGIVPSARSPEAMAASLSVLLDDAARAASIGAGGRDLAVAHHSLRRMVDRHAALYAALAPFSSRIAL